MIYIKRILIGLSAAFLLLVGEVSAGEVVLKSGTKVEGDVTRQSGAIRVESKDGTYTFNLSLVKTIDGKKETRLHARRVRRNKNPQSDNKKARTARTANSSKRGRMHGPVQDVERVRVISPIRLNTLGTGYLHIGRTTHYLKNWEAHGDRLEPVIGRIHSGTALGRDRAGNLHYYSSGHPRFRTFKWKTEEGTRAIQLPSQTTIRLHREK